MPALPARVVEKQLNEWPVAILSTVSADGAPHLVPIVFGLANDNLWSPVDGKPKDGVELQRIRNIERDPRCNVLLESYKEDWSALWWIRLTGEATVEWDIDPDAHPGAVALSLKYPQYARTPLFKGTPTLVRFTPARTTSWCADADQWADHE